MTECYRIVRHNKKKKVLCIRMSDWKTWDAVKQDFHMIGVVHCDPYTIDKKSIYRHQPQ